VGKRKIIGLGTLLIILAAGVYFASENVITRWRRDYNVLLITIDTMRADHLGCYGYSQDTSPNLDQFAKTGVLFGANYAHIPTTGPSHASILTSKYPRKLGLLKNGMVLSQDRLLLSEILKSHGYTTGAVVSSLVLDPQLGFAQGFDDYDAHFSSAGATMGHDFEWAGHYFPGFDQTGDITTRKAIQWLASHPRQKFFLWVHYFDPHAPYSPPEPFAKKFLKKQGSFLENVNAYYDGEILFVDQQIAGLLRYLKEIGIDSKTLIVVTADHGEGLGQHNWMGHGMYLYQEQTHTPLMMSLPKVIPSGVKVKSVVRSIDIAPTILDILGIQREEQFEGESLFPAILDPAQGTDRTVFMERRHYAETLYQGVSVLGSKFGVREGNMKYVWAPEELTEELFDLTSVVSQ